MCRRSRKKLLDGRSYAERLFWPPNSFTEGDLSFVTQRDLRGQQQVKAVGRSERSEGEYQCCRPHQLGIEYYVNFLGGLDSDEFQLK